MAPIPAPMPMAKAAPLTLQQFSVSGTSSAAAAGSLVLPQVSLAGGNYAISGEYGSSSEGTLQLSVNGQYLTLMGYGTNANTYNSTYDVNGNGTALAQSPNVTGNSADVSRVIALHRSERLGQHHHCRSPTCSARTIRAASTHGRHFFLHLRTG